MAGALDSKETLLRPDPATAATGATILRLRAGGRTAAAAFITPNRHGNVDIALNAGKGLLERDVHIMAKVVAATVRLGAAGTAREFGKHLVEDVGKTTATEPAAAKATSAESTRPATGIVKGGMPHPIIGSAFLRVFQNLIGFGGLAESFRRLFIIWVPVGVVLHRQFAIGDFERRFIGVLGHAENIIVITLAHDFAARLTNGIWRGTVASPSTRVMG